MAFKQKIPWSKKEIILALIIPFAYLITAFATIGHYGVNVDEPAHFRRGQAYLYYFLHGKKAFDPFKKGERHSLYQDNNEGGYFYLDASKDQSHPPINDTLAALTNYVFYQKLGVLDDLDAHHVFGIASVGILLLIVYLFARLTFGIFAGTVASLSVFLSPIFLGESHFNIKDPPEAAFFTGTIFFFWLGITRKNAKALIVSALFCALALGTKFNIVFFPFIIGPWLLLIWKETIKQPKRIYLSIAFFPVIVIGIFLASNPNIWQHTFTRIDTMIKFYLSVGTTAGGSSENQPAYLWHGFNTYPIQAILYSTPLVTLLLAGIGIFAVIAQRKKDTEKTGLLFLFWLAIPIIRVTLPGFTIYGGIRHIYEYVPALGIFAGIGANGIVTYLIARERKFFVGVTPPRLRSGSNIRPQKFYSLALLQRQSCRRIFLQGVCLLLFFPITLKIISIHPNENVYLNPLIGGLKGARVTHFPSAGASLGNAYLQGVIWLNKNAEKGACIATPIGLKGNIPEMLLRSDLRYDNTCQSGIERKGEYAMDMVYDGYFNYWYAYVYYATYLKPVYEVKVDDTVILQLFKNDLSHTYPNFRREETINAKKVTIDNTTVNISLPKTVVVSSLLFTYDIPDMCKPVTSGQLLLSIDGKMFTAEPEDISVSHEKANFNPKDQRIMRRIAAKHTRYLRVTTNLAVTCPLAIKNLSVSYLPDVK